MEDQKNPYVRRNIEGKNIMQLRILPNTQLNSNKIFENLPTDISSIEILNQSGKKLIFDLPENIGSYSNLVLIHMDNCVNRVPNSICELPELHFLALTNNKQLRQIPECINEMKELIFVNLKGSNVETILRGESNGLGMYDMSVPQKAAEKSKEEKIKELESEIKRLKTLMVKIKNS